MADQNFQEKTEKPTPKKRQDVRKKGEVAKSRELPSVAVLLSGLLTIAVFASYMNSQIRILMEKVFINLPTKDLDIADIVNLGQETIGLFLLITVPIMAAVFITAVLSNILQVGFLLSGETIKPKLSKLSPIKGFARLFSVQSLMEFAKSMFKLFIIGIVSYFSIKGEIDNIPALVDMELKGILAYILITTLKISLKCALAMVVLVAADYAFQKWQFEKRIKMSKQEVKDELKTSEGDPLVKSRIKSIQMEMSRKRMMQDVPNADVVITNPTHFAVAIKYDSLSMGAPQLLAKGADEVARRIKAIAKEHGIPIVENKELARNLFSSVEIGSEIPVSLYEAVAEVLAYIYKLKNNHQRL
jgi:flagellar biosynthetic protein FlhB